MGDRRGARWAIVLGAGLAVAAVPAPAGITWQSWGLLAIFVSTIAGLMIQPLPGGAMVLLGVSATAGSGRLTAPPAPAGARGPVGGVRARPPLPFPGRAVTAGLPARPA